MCLCVFPFWSGIFCLPNRNTAHPSSFGIRPYSFWIQKIRLKFHIKTRVATLTAISSNGFGNLVLYPFLPFFCFLYFFFLFMLLANFSFYLLLFVLCTYLKKTLHRTVSQLPACLIRQCINEMLSPRLAPQIFFGTILSFRLVSVFPTFVRVQLLNAHAHSPFLTFLLTRTNVRTQHVVKWYLPFITSNIIFVRICFDMSFAYYTKIYALYCCDCSRVLVCRASVLCNGLQCTYTIEFVIQFYLTLYMALVISYNPCQHVFDRISFLFFFCFIYLMLCIRANSSYDPVIF